MASLQPSDKYSASPTVCAVDAQRARPLVLVVEDEPAIARLLDHILERGGYDVLLANSGDEALTLAAARRPDVLTLDLVLPGLSGQDTLVALKSAEATRAIPVVVISIHGDESTEPPLPVYASLRKPLDRAAVLAAVDGALREQPSASAAPTALG